MQSSSLTALGRDSRTSRAITILLGIGFACLLASAGTIFWVQRANETDVGLVSHTLAVEARLGSFASANERVETARRGGLINGDPAFTRLMAEAQNSAAANLDALKQLTSDNPRQGMRIAQLERLQNDYRRYTAEAQAMRGAERERMIAGFMNDPAVAQVRRMRQVVDSMADEERDLLARRQARQKRTADLFYVALGLTGLLILIVATATLRLVRRNLSDLRQSRAELHRLNDDLEKLVDERTAELQRANAEIQRFAYIVSHDLRSPLVNVMGFTSELDTARETIADYVSVLEKTGESVPEDARVAVTEDLPEAIGFIRSSTQKMDRLINAILRLSREGRRTLAPEPLDLKALVEGIRQSLHHRAQETNTQVIVDPLPQIVSDRVAVEQILSNLIENALKYLDLARPGVIRVSGSTAHGRAIIEVADNGRGIDPRDHERIFDLFRRSGVQDQPGEGIGLAHVRALAYRLGGIIEVTSTLGAGATFRLSLPSEWRAGENDV